MRLDKKQVGKKYGRALFELAVEQDVVSIALTELLELRSCFSENPQLGVLLTDQSFALLQKKTILTLLKENVSPLVQKFLGVLFESKRIADLVEIVNDFEKRWLAKEKKTNGIVTTAIPLLDSQKKKIEQEFAKKFKFNSVELTNVVDETIIGGVVIEVNQKRIDGSIKGQLTKMKQRISFA
jgi:F-type H+-transporting ATPase subunit delta